MITTVQLLGQIDILYIKRNVYPAAIDQFTLFAPLEALQSSADRVKLIQTNYSEISTRCTQICTPNFQYQLRNDEISKFNFKDMPVVAEDLKFMDKILLRPN
jgi:hypothetical protein